MSHFGRLLMTHILNSSIRVLPALALSSWLVGGAFSGAARAEGITLQKDVKPLLQEYCLDCHNAEKQKGDLNLADYLDNEKLYQHRDVWEKVLETVELGDMPPRKSPQLQDKEKDTLLHYIEGQLAKFDCETDKNPGRVTVRRLNRDEYRNTIRDLLHVDYSPEDFPNDEVGYGFDNIGDVLSLSPMLMEKFLAAAEQVAQKAVVLPEPGPGKRTVRNEWAKLTSKGIVWNTNGNGAILAGSGEMVVQVEAKGRTTGKLRLRASGDLAGRDLPKLRVRVGAKEIKTFEINNKRDNPRNYEVEIPLEAGKQEIGIAFLNDYYGGPDRPPEERGDRNVHLHSIEVEGAFALLRASEPESHKRLITKMPQPGQEIAVAKELLRPFVERAYRRPVTDGELKRIVGFVEMAMKQGGGFLEGMQIAVQAVLCSPRFLFRWELDNSDMKPGEARGLSDWELASRLSYFLWSSMPDEELFALARKGELQKDGNLEKQVVRMMKDWRARQFVRNFAGQWLQIRGIWEAAVDPETFPRWSDDLKGLMLEESERFFEALMKEDRSVLELIDADFTFLNEKLANYYGIRGVKGREFRRVQLPPDSPRGGVITHGSVLLSTSTPTRTSPVIRGKWILEQILGTPPPAAPPDVPPLQEGKQVAQSASLRKRLEQHMSQADCASCHKRMDPLGFALENFDATGAWRDKDGKFPIDASGKMPNGQTFNGPKELKKTLKGPGFVRNLTEKMMIYALGRGLEYYDRCAVDDIAEKLGPKGNRFSALITGIVTSEPFLKRRLEGESLAKN